MTEVNSHENPKGGTKMSEEIRTEEVMDVEITGVDDANDKFGIKDGLILAGIGAAGYGFGKLTEKVVPKIVAKVKNLKDKLFKRKDVVVEQETAEKTADKKTKNKSQKSEKTTED